MLYAELASFGKARVNIPFLNTQAAMLADRVADRATNYAKLSLVSFGKVATGGTLKSVHWERRDGRNSALFGVAASGLQRRQVLAGKGWFFIQSGRRAGAKMPVRQVGTGPRGGKIFEPLPALVAWFNALAIPKSAWFPILRAIKARGIKPTPLSQRAVQMAMPAIREEVAMAGGIIRGGIIQVS